MKKVLLVVTGNEGEVYIDELGNEDDDDENDAGEPPRRRQRYQRDEVLALHSQIATLR